MTFGDALTAIQTATLTEVKNDNPKKMSIGEGEGEIIIRIGVNPFDDKTLFLYREYDEYTACIPWRPTQAQMFSKEWKLM